MIYRKHAFAYLLLLSALPAQAITTQECNEKIRLQIVADAKAKCSFKDLYWSEKETNASEDQKDAVALFSFRCTGGKKYLGLTQFTFGPSCEVSPSQISHTSPVPSKPVASISNFKRQD